MTRIFLSAPHLTGEERRYVDEAFETNWLSSGGPNLVAFEEAFTELVGVPCVALGSGTAAIHLGLRLLGVGRDDTVVCPTLTFAASCNPIVYEGASPVFVDCERTSFNIDPALVDEAITTASRRGKRPKALIVVHLYGQSADMDALTAVAAKHDVPIVEDAAEALGTHYRGKQVGAVGAVGAFSFNGNKILTTSGGGMLVSPRRDWVEKARHWSTQAKDPGLAYEHSELGFNYRMSNVLAGVGRGQLPALESRVAARRAIAFRYRDAFADLEGLQLMPQASWGRHTNWLSVFLMDPRIVRISRDDLLRALAAKDIEARPVWKPMHMQRFYASAERVGGSVAEEVFARGFCLPSSSSLSESDQQRVIDAVRELARS